MFGFTMLLILSTIIVNFAAAQQSASIGIRITSPVEGQQILVPDNNLKITGIASHNGLLSCNVYIIVNDIKPYQKALPTGGHGKTIDYSTWTYNLVPSYTTIKTGTNKITSKLACQQNNASTSNTSLTQFYSINVTGTAATTKQQNVTGTAATTKQQGQSLKNSLALSNNNLKAVKLMDSSHTNSQPTTLLSTAGILSLSAPRIDKLMNRTTNTNIDQTHLKSTNSKSSLGLTLSTTNSGDVNLNNNSSAESAKQEFNTLNIGRSDLSSGSKHSNDGARSLSVSIHVAKGPIYVGNKENLTLGVTDNNSTHAIAGAAIFGKITNPSGISKKLEGITDRKGRVLYSWPITGDNTSGKYKVVMEASAPGYENNSVSKTFTLYPIRNISSNNGNTTSLDLLNINNNSPNAEEVTSRPIITTFLSKNKINHNSPLLFSNQNGRVYIPSPNSLSYENGRVYIPSPGYYNNNNNINNMMSSYTKVDIPTPGTNSTRKPVEQGINPVQRPVEQGINPVQRPVEQGINPVQKPQLPDNNELPFVMATPTSLHINKGTSLPASHQISSITMAIDLVDRMRVIGFDSGLLDSP
jgi:hypothetical protein